MSNTGQKCAVPEEQDGIKVIHKTESITIRERTEVNQFKVEAMKDFLDVIADEDVDTMFLAMLEAGKQLGYNLKGEPETILAAVNKGFSGGQETVHPGS